MITSYRPPRQLLRLLGTLRRAQPESPIVVHHDRFRSSWDAGLVAAIGGVDVLTSAAPVSWGDFSIVDVTWKSLSWMVEHRDFDWVVFLSEQDYPIAPLDKLEAALATSGVDAFIEAKPIDRIEDADLRMDCDRRYNYQYMALPRPGIDGAASVPGTATGRRCSQLRQLRPYKLQRKVTVYRYPDPLPMRLGVRPARSPFSPAFPCWYGSQWMALSRRAAADRGPSSANGQTMSATTHGR